MPQLDTTTYLGQVTWFTFVFSLFYFVVLTDVLPRINRAVKVRAKKLDRTRDDARQFDAERTTADQSYARSTSSAASSSLALLMGTEDLQSKWATHAAWTLSNKEGSLVDAHAAYLEAIVQVEASVAVLHNIMDGVTEMDSYTATDE